MEKKTLVWLAASLLVFMVFGSVNTVMAQLVEVTNAQLVGEAPTIVRGEVTAQRSEWNDEQTFIWTFVTMTVTETLKGSDVTGQEIEVKIPNGTVGEITQMSSNQVAFQEGEDALVFLGTETYKGESYYNVVRLSQGKFSFEGGEVSGALTAAVTAEEFMAAIRQLVRDQQD